MDVTRYIFQSPYTSQVQVGRPDPSVKQEQSTQQGSSELTQNTNQTLQDAQTFQTNQTQEVKPTVSTTNSLDVYA